MKRTLTVAAIQLPAHDREAFDDVWPGIRTHVADAANNGADIVVLPEGTIPAYVLGELPLDASLIERSVKDLRDDASRLRVLVICGLGRAHASSQYNSAIVIDTNGDVAGYADKAFLWHFDRRWFSAAESITPIATSIGRIGALVCADGRIPTIARSLVDAGAEILVMPTAWVTSGRNPNVLENVQADLLARVRARENGVPFVAANKSGVERGCVAYCGKSQIIGADGTVLALAPEHDPAIIASELELGAAPARRAGIPHVAARVADTTARIAIALVDDAHLREAATLLEATTAIAPGSYAGFASLDDNGMGDPGVAVAYRRAGHRLLVWESRAFDAAWVEPIARARALELRIYLVVLDHARERAFAVDPDGVVIAGTYGDLRVASFVFDAVRTAQTTVAPGTDIAVGLERIAALTEPR